MGRTLAIDIFEYLDYRRFLRDAYRDLKRRQRGFSYRWFARKAGMSSPNFLKLVIDGQRNLTPRSTERFARALDLTGQETAFFREIVGFAQASTPAERNRCFERIGAYRRHLAVRKLERQAFEYLSRWYYPAIREMVSCRGFREDPEWIGARLVPPVSPARVRTALSRLLELGVLQRDEDGVLRQGDPLLTTGPEVRSLAVGNFHRQMLERAAEAIDLVDRDKRDISSVTVSLSPEAFHMFKQKIGALRSELLELSADETEPTRVVQFNFQAFPLAETEDEDS